MRNPAAKVSAHYMVDRDGTIYQLVPDDRAAWHAGVAQLHGDPGAPDSFQRACAGRRGEEGGLLVHWGRPLVAASHGELIPGAAAPARP